MNLIQVTTSAPIRKDNGRLAAAFPLSVEARRTMATPLSDRDQLEQWFAAGSHAVLGYAITPSMAMVMMERRGNVSRF